MSNEQSLLASQAARTQRWWVPFTLLGTCLAILGIVLLFSHDGAIRALGRASLAASGIALLGVVLTFSWWGRAIMGVRHYRRRWFPFLFSVRGWIQAGTLMLFFSLTAGLGYTMEPDFCTSCHLMVPYYQAWHQSTHKNVRCTDCHFAPGLEGTLRGKFQASSMLVKYITRTYGSKPHAEIQDASCLRSGCHSDRLLEGKARWDLAKPNGAVINLRFNHTPHLGNLRRGKQLRCTSCHGQVVQGEHIAVTLDTCFACHFKGLHTGRDEEVIAGCTGCHDAPKQQIKLATGVFDHKSYIDRGVACFNCHGDSIKGDGEVPRQVCTNCHNRPEHLERIGESNFMHQTHVTDHKLRCIECHMKIEHSIDANAGQNVAMGGGAGDSCARCHQSMHAGPAELYRGTGGRGVPDMPSPMFRTQVDCIGCHQMKQHGDLTARVTGQTFVAVQQACNMCHGDTADPATGKYADRLGEWKRVLNERMAEVSPAVAEAAKALASAQLDSPTKLALERKLADAQHNIAFVQLGHGVHNFNYAVALLNVAADYSRQVMTACAAKVDDAPK